MSHRKRKPTYIFRVFVEAEFNEVFERFTEVAGQLRRIVLRDEEQRPHRVQLGMRRLALRQLDRGDTETPDVDLFRTAPQCVHLVSVKRLSIV